MKYVKGSFLMVPNKYYLAELEPHVQSVYLWVCNFANEEGTCFPSRTSLARLAGCSVKSVDRALEILSEKKLLEKINRKDGDRNLTNIYQLMILEGGSGVPKSLGSVSESLGVASEGRTELNPVLTQISATREELEITEENTKTKQPPKYPHSKEVFSWFNRPEKSWALNTTELKHAELLFERGERKVKSALAFVAKHKDDEFFYKITKPSDLERKWEDLISYRV